MSFQYADYVKARKRLAPLTSRLIARTLMEADRRLERHKRFVKRIEDAKAMSIHRFKALPKNATIRKEYVKCGKSGCELSHGPYYYAYWKEKSRTEDNDNEVGLSGKLKKKYIGAYLPEEKHVSTL